MAIDFIPRHFDVDRHGVPTDYGGTRFRSRLEARWAAFFDLVKWPWTYEPMDLAGYIPDFVLSFKRGPVIAEVKPAVERAELAAAARKLCLGGWRGDYLLLGSVMWGDAIGLYDYVDDVGGGPEWLGADDAEAHRCFACRSFSVHHASQGWHCIVCNAYDGNAGLLPLGDGELVRLWRESGNRVQWRGDSARGAQVDW